jgi:peptide/nickel transport system substrate-binding protein
MQEKKKYIALIASFVVLLTGLLPVPATSLNGNAYELTIGNIGEPESLDPHWMYDSASMEFLHNVIECLIDYDGTSVEEFLPELATDWDWDEATLTYTFTIREGVPWHDPAYGTVTPEDVEYSIERAMVMDHGGGPQWMLYEPLLGIYTADNDDDGLPDAGIIDQINDAVTVSDNTVIFHFATTFPPLIFLQTFSQVWAGIIDKDWAIEQGCWDGVYTQESAETYYNPATSPLMDPDPVCMGTGPYVFDIWVRGAGGYWSQVKFDDYWGGWPAYSAALGRDTRGYVTRVTSNYVEEWATRKLMFLAGDLDVCYVPRLYMGDVWAQPGIECRYPNAEISCDSFFMNVNISLNSRYLRPPFSE